MTRLMSLIAAAVAAALVFVAPTWADDWGRDAAQPAVRISPDLQDRAAAASQSRMATVLDARERSFATKRTDSSQVVPNRDWFERAAAAAVRNEAGGITAAATDVVTESSAQSGRELAWSQLGAGFGIGLLLALGIYACVRIARTRPLAH